ncbi:hypothetical protein HDE_05704 [Halotydeus destructor]|nr:hypothetical protein HDE_05704 [Halotydeus destructor]
MNCLVLAALLVMAVTTVAGQYSKCGSHSPCLAPSGLFADKNSCCHFYNCDNCRAYRQPCGPGTQFADHLKVCVHPGQSKCYAGDQYCHLKKQLPKAYYYY